MKTIMKCPICGNCSGILFSDGKHMDYCEVEIFCMNDHTRAEMVAGVASVKDCCDCVCHITPGIGPKKSDAKSRLVMAVNDLLEAARWVLNEAGKRNEITDEQGEPYDDYKALRAAIAKATEACERYESDNAAAAAIAKATGDSKARV